HQNRGRHREQERPVGRREDVDDVGATEPTEARKIEGLVEYGARVRPPPDPAEPPREARVDGDERDLVARLSEPAGERLRLHRLAARDLRARRDERDPQGWTSNGST